jgi:hypothetical protein
MTSGQWVWQEYPARGGFWVWDAACQRPLWAPTPVPTQPGPHGEWRWQLAAPQSRKPQAQQQHAAAAVPPATSRVPVGLPPGIVLGGAAQQLRAPAAPMVSCLVSS